MRTATRHVLLSILTFGIWFFLWAYRAARRTDRDEKALPLLRWGAILGPVAVILIVAVLVLSLVVVLDATGVFGTAWADDSAPPPYFWVMIATSLLVNLFWVPAIILTGLGLYRLWQTWGVEDPTVLVVLLIAGAVAFPPLLWVVQWLSEEHLERMSGNEPA